MKIDLERANKFAKMADIAYKDDASFKQFGYTDSIFIDKDGAQAYAVWNDKEIIFVFRGTEPNELSDVLADLNALPKKSMTDGWVHSGFRGELDKIWSDIKPLAESHKEKDCFVCGHSLGAAMATICTSRLEEFRSVNELYTYGSPRVGTCSFVRGVKTTHWRFVNNNDVVTRVPLFLMGYKHHGNLVYINHYGKIRKMTIWQRMKDRFRGWRDGLLDPISDHGMPNYVNYTVSND